MLANAITRREQRPVIWTTDSFRTRRANNAGRITLSY
jgi:hypothetical protein